MIPILDLMGVTQNCELKVIYYPLKSEDQQEYKVQGIWKEVDKRLEILFPTGKNFHLIQARPYYVHINLEGFDIKYYGNFSFSPTVCTLKVKQFVVTGNIDHKQNQLIIRTYEKLDCNTSIENHQIADECNYSVEVQGIYNKYKPAKIKPLYLGKYAVPSGTTFKIEGVSNVLVLRET